MTGQKNLKDCFGTKQSGVNEFYTCEYVSIIGQSNEGRGHRPYCIVWSQIMVDRGHNMGYHQPKKRT